MTASKKFLLALAVGGALAAAPARGETRPTTTDLYNYLVKLGPIAFNKAGAAFLPLSILQAMKQGRVSPVLQFVLANNMLTQCVKEVLKAPPGIRDPYVVAKAKFDYGVCRETACFKQAMLVMLLPTLSGNGRNGGSSDPEGAKSTAALLANAYKKQDGCAGDGGSAIDPMILTLLVGN